MTDLKSRKIRFQLENTKIIYRKKPNIFGKTFFSYERRDISSSDSLCTITSGLPNKSLVQKGKDSKGGKFAKERLTVLHMCNQDGSDKRKPMVIGRAKRPRAFKEIPTDQLPVQWEFNKKAWMTRAIFEPFLRKFDREMQRKKRKVVLFMDNATSHKIDNLNLRNVEIKFFPPNVTSQIQPLDLGIIRAFKARYKKKLLQSILSNMKEKATPSEILKCITVLDAVHTVL